MININDGNYKIQPDNGQTAPKASVIKTLWSPYQMLINTRAAMIRPLYLFPPFRALNGDIPRFMAHLLTHWQASAGLWR